jgi:excinuclease ABC subunit A
MESIRIRGARTHNLKNIDVDLPRHRLIVITGLSGSGKSSLAFDTLYAEGQRRYVESLSAYARQFLQIMDKPDVDLIEGLSPAISIEQKATSHNPRSTVGTVTEIHDYLRLLFARAGIPLCPEHHLPLQSQTISQIADHLLSGALDRRIMILAPVVHEKKGEHIDVLESLRVQGFVRVRLDGILYDLDDLPKLTKTKKHSIDVVVDRLKVRPDTLQRISESVEMALRLGNERILVVEMDDENREQWFSSRHACSICDYSIPELEPRLFSFNSPQGACPDCDGLGIRQFFDKDRVVAHPDLSLAEGAIRGWDERNQFYFQMLKSLAVKYQFDVYQSFKDLAPEVQKVILWGSGKELIEFRYMGERGNLYVKEQSFEGIIPNFERRFRETDSSAVRDELMKYQSRQACHSCQGERLCQHARSVIVGGKTLGEVNRLSLDEAFNFFDHISLSSQQMAIAEKIIHEIKARLMFLNNVGLNYLSLARSAETLSGGEAQRIRLASQIGSGLTGVMYVLDEPSIGLHQRDNDRLLETLKHLRDLGNTVIVVEHDEDAIRLADFIIDMGPGAGVHGGYILVTGTPQEIIQHPDSITGQFLSGRRRIPLPTVREPANFQRMIEVIGARGNNLKRVHLKLPLGLLVCITGVSGSGKSTLINDTLCTAVMRELHGSTPEPAPFDDIKGLEHIDKLIHVDQSPIGRTPRSNPATYTGMFTPIRELFAGVPLARERGYQAGRFSFNVKGGRCEACEGDGMIKVEMHFLPDVYAECEVCQGKRYNRETLDIRYRDKNIHEILNMTVEQAHEFFSAVPTVDRKLQTLLDVGLGYIRLGQSATTLSGGEAQRVKLALELSKRDTGRTLYVLDEPTTGLHFHDIDLLVNVLQRLRGKGNTVVVIEHNLDVIKTADWVIDLGPEGGDRGGEILVEGPPEHIAEYPQSYTGQYLKSLLKENIPK